MYNEDTMLRQLKYLWHLWLAKNAAFFHVGKNQEANLKHWRHSFRDCTASPKKAATIHELFKPELANAECKQSVKTQSFYNLSRLDYWFCFIVK